MTIEDIKKLIAQDETRVLELKKTTGELIKGMQTLYAFLNSDGGRLFFGVTPKLEIFGQNVTDSTQREIAHEMTKIEPAISLPIEIVEIPERPGCCVIEYIVMLLNLVMRHIHTMEEHTIRLKAQQYRCHVQCLKNGCVEVIQIALRGKVRHQIIFIMKIWTRNASKGLFRMVWTKGVCLPLP